MYPCSECNVLLMKPAWGKKKTNKQKKTHKKNYQMWTKKYRTVQFRTLKTGHVMHYGIFQTNITLFCSIILFFVPQMASCSFSFMKTGPTAKIISIVLPNTESRSDTNLLKDPTSSIITSESMLCLDNVTVFYLFFILWGHEVHPNITFFNCTRLQGN